jgi:hypothetical protein
LPGRRPWAIEIKRGLTPKEERGFHPACEDIAPERRIVIYPGIERYPLRDGIDVMPLEHVGRALVEV